MSKEKTFENVISELEQIITKLDEGEISLEESVTLYKEGMVLVKQCNEKLDTVEKELEIIREV
jgi:exodeoxyribonuclease VII small subunit